MPQAPHPLPMHHSQLKTIIPQLLWHTIGTWCPIYSKRCTMAKQKHNGFQHDGERRAEGSCPTSASPLPEEEQELTWHPGDKFPVGKWLPPHVRNDLLSERDEHLQH